MLPTEQSNCHPTKMKLGCVNTLHQYQRIKVQCNVKLPAQGKSRNTEMQLNDQKAAKNKTIMRIHTTGSNFILSLSQPRQVKYCGEQSLRESKSVTHKPEHFQHNLIVQYDVTSLQTTQGPFRADVGKSVGNKICYNKNCRWNNRNKISYNNNCR